MTKCRLCGQVHRITRRQAQRLQAATPAKLRRLTSGLTPRQLTRRPKPRKWSIQEIALHLHDVELAFAFRYRVILAEPGGVLTPFDGDHWANRLHYRRQNLRAALETFTTLRREHLAMLSRLTTKQWQQWAKHTEFPGYRYRLEPAFIHLAAHDLSHLAQIRTLRRRWLAQ
ncbi:MAG: DinB family protein [Candidatus Acidiferrales bacterium]